MSGDTRSIRRHLLAAWIAMALALALGACKKDENQTPKPPASLWAFAPPQSAFGVVIQPGAAAEVADSLRELGRIMSSYPVSSTWLLRFRHTVFPGVVDPFDPKFFTLSGLDPEGGFAVFGTDSGPSLVILSVADRDRFRSTAGLEKFSVDGMEVDADYVTACAELRGVYACAEDREALVQAMKEREPQGLAARVPALPADVRGAIEFAIDPLQIEDPSQFGELEPTVMFFAASLGDGRITMRAFMDGLPDQPYGVRNLSPSAAIGDLGRGAVGIWRVGLVPELAFEELEELAPLDEAQRAVFDNLTGEIVAITKGTGPSAGLVALGIHDVEVARRQIAEGCAEVVALTGQDLQMRAGACEGTAMVPEVGPPGTDPFGEVLRGLPVSTAVIDDMLVFSIGHTVTGRAVSPPELPDGAWAVAMTLRSLDPLATAPEWSAIIQEGIELNAGPDLAATVTAVRWILAHVAELTLGARLVDGGFVIEATALTYGSDPPDVHAAYEAAVHKLLAYDVAGYVAAMAELEERFDTRAGRQARLVGDRAPTMFPGIALVASSYIAASLAGGPGAVSTGDTD
jgi:hypothetical protein